MVLDSDERDLFLKEIKQLRKQLDDKKQRERDYERFIAEARLYAETPKDQFSHSYKLIFHPKMEPGKLSELFDPDILLSFIKDPQTLMLYQNDFDLLSKFFDMGTRSHGIMEFFKMLFYPWVGQMRMTGALGGNERFMQSFLEPTQAPYEGFSFLEKQQMKKQTKSQRKNWMAHLKDFSNQTRWGNDLY